MANRGMGFVAWCVRALLEGRKNQTMRIVRPQPVRVAGPWTTSLEAGDRYIDVLDRHLYKAIASRGRDKRAAGVLTPLRVKAPYQPGDVVYVKEKIG